VKGWGSFVQNIPGMYKLLFTLLLLTATVSAQQNVASGLDIGERAPAHNPTHITGPDAGTTICPV
jgi:hypothetical protein